MSTSSAPWPIAALASPGLRRSSAARASLSMSSMDRRAIASRASLSGGLARRELDPVVRRQPRRELPFALELGVELRPEQEGEVGDPEPDQEHHHAGQGAVGLVVGAVVRDVYAEARG